VGDKCPCTRRFCRYFFYRDAINPIGSCSGKTTDQPAFMKAGMTKVWAEAVDGSIRAYEKPFLSNFLKMAVVQNILEAVLSFLVK